MPPSFCCGTLRYLAFLAAACAIAASHLGPITLLVWLLTAIALRPFGQERPASPHDHSPSQKKCP